MTSSPRARVNFALGAILLASGARAGALEEIIVTATRNPVALERYAGSATRIGPDTVELTDATHAAELVNRAAGAMIQRGSGQESLTALRSPVLTGAGACGAVLVLEDSIPIRPVGTCNVNELFEVNFEQAVAIEVLRGPGSVLYGSSAVHGIINVIPPRPDQLPEFGVAAEYGSDAWRRLRLAGSRQDDGRGIGLAMIATDDGGWRDASGFEERKLYAAWATALGQGSLKLSVSGSNLDQETAGFIQGEDAYRDPAVARSNPVPEAYRDANSLRVAAQYADASGHALRFVLRRSRMDFLQHFLLGQPVEDNGQDSAGFLFTARPLALAGGELIAGADAELANSSLLQFQAGPTTGGPPAANEIRPAGKHYDYTVDSGVLAGYANWRRALAAEWSLEAGLRLEHARYDYDNRMIDGNTDEDGVPCPGGCLYARPADRTDEFTNLAPRIALLWSASDATTAYLSLARGFRAPEATELYRLQRQQTVANLDSETIDAAELGLRWRADPRGLARPGAVHDGQGRRDPARLGGLQRERRPDAAPGPRVPGRLGVCRGLAALGGWNLRESRVSLHGAGGTGRADHLGQRHRHRATRHPCAAPALRRRAAGGRTGVALGGRVLGERGQHRALRRARRRKPPGRGRAGAKLDGDPAHHQPAGYRVRGPRGFRLRQFPLFPGSRPRILPRARLAKGLIHAI